MNKLEGLNVGTIKLNSFIRLKKFNAIIKNDFSLKEETEFKNKIGLQYYFIISSASALYSTPYCILRSFFENELRSEILTDFNLFYGHNKFVANIKRNNEIETWNFEILI